MSNFHCVLAYAADAEMDERELEARINSATKYVAPLYKGAVRKTSVGDGRSGIIAWEPVSRWCQWPLMTLDAGGAGVSWLHVPAAAGGPSDGIDPMALAERFARGEVPATELGAPGAMLLWKNGQLTIENDAFGLARLYEYVVPGFGRIWSSRYGLAHVFGGFEPVMNRRAWESMTAYGWTVAGETHMGYGRQVPPFMKVYVNADGVVTQRSGLESWVTSVLAGPEPDLAHIAEDMSSSLRRAAWWPQRPVSDLSGGKDSRVTTAAGIRAGVVDAVRTVNTDPGEVSTAQQLLSLRPERIQHRVEEVRDQTQPDGGFVDRLASMQRAWEGACLPQTALRGGAFTGFQSVPAAKINGLGGEAMQGRSLVSPVIAQRLDGGGMEAGLQRIARVGGTALGMSESARDSAFEQAKTIADRAQQMGITEANAVVDFFYNFSRMPYWSLPQAQEAVLIPYYSPRIMDRIIWSMEHPAEHGALHKKLLESLAPEWAQVPFYKPPRTGAARKWVWDDAQWPQIRDAVETAVSRLDNYVADQWPGILREIEDGEAAGRQDTYVARVLWEESFRESLSPIAALAAETATEVAAARVSGRGE